MKRNTEMKERNRLMVAERNRMEAECNEGMND